MPNKNDHPFALCPNCDSVLEPEEIAAGECWACLKPLPTLKSEYDAEFDDDCYD